MFGRLEIIKYIPLIISTIFKHYTHGPPQPSWDLKTHLFIKICQNFISKGPAKTIEEVQCGRHSIIFINKIPTNIKINKIIISHGYRINAQVYIEKLVEPYNIAIDPIWKSPRNNEINGELIMNEDWSEENVDWEKEKIIIYFHGGAYFTGSIANVRKIICELSKESGARVLAISYRLAPQQPFPAALCDALAAYLYLTNPSNDSGFKPYKPEQIILCGDSAGAGLAISLGLALRDLGLPLPAGIVGWSPWIDLTHSMPSFFEPIMNETDFLPPKPGFLSANPNSNAYREFRSRTRTIIENIQQHPEIKLIGDDSLKRIGNESINFYIVNEGLGIPYVSPMLAESLGGLPPILIIAGNVERFRDESIYFSCRAVNPEKYRLPTYEIDFNNSRFKTPTKVTLEIYDEMFHIFQFIKAGEQTKMSIKRTSDFINNVIKESSSADTSSYNFKPLKISYNGEAQDLDESTIDNVLKWDKVGVFPDV